MGPTSQSGEVCGGLNIELLGGIRGRTLGKGGLLFNCTMLIVLISSIVFFRTCQSYPKTEELLNHWGDDQTPEGGPLSLSHVI